MHVVEVGVAGRPAAGVRATAVPGGRRGLAGGPRRERPDAPAPVTVKLAGRFAGATRADRTRTSAEEDAAALPAVRGAGGAFSDTLPARSMAAYRVAAAGK